MRKRVPRAVSNLRRHLPLEYTQYLIMASRLTGGGRRGRIALRPSCPRMTGGRSRLTLKMETGRATSKLQTATTCSVGLHAQQIIDSLRTCKKDNEYTAVLVASHKYTRLSSLPLRRKRPSGLTAIFIGSLLHLMLGYLEQHRNVCYSNSPRIFQGSSSIPGSNSEVLQVKCGKNIALA